MADEPIVDVRSELGGSVVETPVNAGDEVAVGATLLWVESMKMHHPVTSPVAGTVVSVACVVGDTVARGAVVVRVAPGRTDGAMRDPDATVAPERDALVELRARRAWLDDAARPEQVARRHAQGRRTARENLADLVDPGTWVEYGGLAVAGQRAVRSEDELVERTPADGFIAGLGSVNGDLVGAERSTCAVASYDYMVLAGTQGMVGHLKKDRLFDVVMRTRIPVVLFAEGGGGRPSDTDHPVVSGLTTNAFRSWAALDGVVPRIGVAAGYCFAGNAGLLGGCDVIVATRGASIGMGGPAMIAGAGLGSVAPQDVGPAPVLHAAGVVDVLVDDDAAAVDAARRALSFFQGPARTWSAADQRALRDAVPAERTRAYDVRAVLRTLADDGSVLELRDGYGRSVVTALARLEGRPVGVVASDPGVDAGAVTADAAEKSARFLRLCESYGSRSSRSSTRRGSWSGRKPRPPAWCGGPRASSPPAPRSPSRPSRSCCVAPTDSGRRRWPADR